MLLYKKGIYNHFQFKSETRLKEVGIVACLFSQT